MQKSNLIATLSCVSVLLVSTLSLAYESGDIIFRAGPANVDPDSSSGLINLGGTPLAGTAVQVEDDTQLGLTLTYMLNQHWAIELLASTPFEHKIIETGVGVNRVGTAEHLPPTLTVQYYPMAADSAFQTYVGAGLNYTTFFSEETASELDNALGEGDFSLDDSFGLALEIGADYAINDNCLLNLSVWCVDIETDAEIITPAGQVKVDVVIDPMVYMFGVGYKF
ncbi:MAG: outer membrane protein [Cryomorphaceae bacterium]|jgi:outer membrane protein